MTFGSPVSHAGEMLLSKNFVQPAIPNHLPPTRALHRRQPPHISTASAVARQGCGASSAPPSSLLLVMSVKQIERLTEHHPQILLAPERNSAGIVVAGMMDERPAYVLPIHGCRQFEIEPQPCKGVTVYFLSYNLHSIRHLFRVHIHSHRFSPKNLFC